MKFDPSRQSLTSKCGPVYLISLSLEPQDTWSFCMFSVCCMYVPISWHSWLAPLSCFRPWASSISRLEFHLDVLLPGKAGNHFLCILTLASSVFQLVFSGNMIFLMSYIAHLPQTTVFGLCSLYFVWELAFWVAFSDALQFP